MGRVDRQAQRVEVVGRTRRVRLWPVRAPLRGVADDLHPRGPGRHLGLDSRDEFVRFAGARNRPAAVTTGRPAVAERANSRVAWLRPPTSRITVTPLAAYSSRRAAPYSLSARNGPCSSLATVGC